MSQPLTGIKVVDFSHVMAGPFCSHFLCMLGAEIIKVESLKGDALRNYGPFREYDGMSPAFIAANVGKKSIAIDLKSEPGRAIARRLIAQSDVLLENFRPGVMERHGLSYAECRAIRPELIYCAISGYGQRGPMRNHSAIDNIVQATSGIMACNGGPEDPPTRVGWPVVDTYTGTLAALAVLAALFQRERTGQGQYIDVAMLDASVVMLTSLATPYLVTGQMLPRTGDVGYSGAPTSAIFTAADDHRVSLGVVQNNHFATLCQVLGRPELIDDARFADPAARAQPENARYLQRWLSQAFLRRPAEEWERELSARGVPCGLVRNIGEVCDAVRDGERGLTVPTQVSLPGKPDRAAAYVNAGFVFEHDGPGVAGRAPMLGEHTHEVLRALGYPAEEIARLTAEGIVSSVPQG